jgi:hydrogenase-4 component F
VRPRRAGKAGFERFPERSCVILPPLLLMGVSLWLGLFPPPVLCEAWSAAVAQLFPSP